MKRWDVERSRWSLVGDCPDICLGRLRKSRRDVIQNVCFTINQSRLVRRTVLCLHSRLLRHEMVLDISRGNCLTLHLISNKLYNTKKSILFWESLTHTRNVWEICRFLKLKRVLIVNDCIVCMINTRADLAVNQSGLDSMIPYWNSLQMLICSICLSVAVRRAKYRACYVSYQNHKHETDVYM